MTIQKGYLFSEEKRKSILRFCSCGLAAVMIAGAVCGCASQAQESGADTTAETAAAGQAAQAEENLESGTGAAADDTGTAIEISLNSDCEPMSEEDTQLLVTSLYDTCCEEAVQDPDRISETTYTSYTTQYESEEDTFDVGTISWQGYEMRYGIQVIGQPDENGLYPLYIALHGGGAAEPEENDSQWEDMFYYYRDSVTNGIYVNTRGISDTWNLHFLDESYYLYDRLIEDMILFEHVDPNRIYVVGFSAGGDGVYQIAAHMADRFAAANMSSGHSNWVSLLNLANLPILLQAGIRDNYYDRNTITVESGEQLDSYADAYGFGYQHEVYIHVPEGHNYQDNDPEEGALYQVVADLPGFISALENDEAFSQVVSDPDNAYPWNDEINALTQEAADAAGIVTEEVDPNAIRWVSQYTRDPFPEELVWDLNTRAGLRTVQSFYYLKAPEETKGLLTASYDREANAITIDASGVEGDFSVLFSPLMLDLSQPVTLTVNDMTFLVHVNPSEDCIRASFAETSDLYRCYAAEISYAELLALAAEG